MEYNYFALKLQKIEKEFWTPKWKSKHVYKKSHNLHPAQPEMRLYLPYRCCTHESEYAMSEIINKYLISYYLV